MNKQFPSFLHSFKLNKNFGMTFFADFFFFAFFMILFSWFNSTVQSQSIIIMQGKTAEQIKEMIASSSLEAVPFLQEPISFMIFVIGTILLINQKELLALEFIKSNFNYPLSLLFAHFSYF